jgi:hypothetical protein
MSHQLDHTGIENRENFPTDVRGLPDCQGRRHLGSRRAQLPAGRTAPERRKRRAGCLGVNPDGSPEPAPERRERCGSQSDLLVLKGLEFVEEALAVAHPLLGQPNQHDPDQAAAQVVADGSLVSHVALENAYVVAT